MTDEHRDWYRTDSGLHRMSSRGTITKMERLEARTADLERVIGDFRWLGNNLHNSDTETFREMYRACLEDARLVMGDDWQPIDVRKPGPSKRGSK